MHTVHSKAWRHWLELEITKFGKLPLGVLRVESGLITVAQEPNIEETHSEYLNLS